jgi:hypothetical protein
MIPLLTKPELIQSAISITLNADARAQVRNAILTFYSLVYYDES